VLEPFVTTITWASSLELVLAAIVDPQQVLPEISIRFAAMSILSVVVLLVLLLWFPLEHRISSFLWHPWQPEFWRAF
jgi:hypothetical protein